MKTIEEIENYIKEQEQNGALLVTGKWGSGKTYLMRQIERKLNQGPQYLMAVVSLFGIEDTNTLTKKVKEAVVYAQTFNKAEKSGKGHIAKGVNVVKQLSEKVAAFGELFDFGKIKKIAKSANMLLSIDVYDFLPIEKEVYCIVAGEEQPVKKKLVLVFDDFERCKIGVIDLLGIINTYVEDNCYGRCASEQSQEFYRNILGYHRTRRYQTGKFLCPLRLSKKLKSLYYNAPCPSKNQHRGGLLQARFRPEVQNSVSFLAEGRRGWHRPIGGYCRLRC